MQARVARLERREGVIQKLEYIKKLNVAAVWLSPVTESGYNGYHG